MYALTTIQPDEDTPITAGHLTSGIHHHATLHLGEGSYPGFQVLGSDPDVFERIAAAATECANLLRAHVVPPAVEVTTCDHCDQPARGGAAGGGLPPEHWCDAHRPGDFGAVSA